MRRVKNVDDDYDDYAPAASSKAKAKAKPGAAKAKPGAAKAKAAAAAPPKPAAKPPAVDELLLALGDEVESERVESALKQAAGGRPEDAFLALLSEELGAGRWQNRRAAAAVPEPAPAPPAEGASCSSAPAPAAESAAAGPQAGFAPAPRKGDAGASPAAEDDGDDEPPPPPDAGGKPGISLVVVGHVDAGKSTLMGHLLCLVGTVSTKQLHKFEKESKQMGKASFAFAWVLDEGDDERQRGVTIDVCVKHFETKANRFTILDAPGHRDFVPNMLQGAVQADVALVVVDVSHFEAGFERGGQTKEHLQLVRSLGISQILVAVNKLDSKEWSEEVYENIKGRVHAFATGPECGFKASGVSYIPLSGFTGENMLERKEPKLGWWTGPTLIEALDTLKAPPRPAADGALRISVSDVYRSGSTSVVSGRVEGGTAVVGQKVVLMPSGEQTVIKSLLVHEEVAKCGRVGEFLDQIVLPVEPQFVNIGGVVSSIRNPVPCVDTFQAQILVFDLDLPLMRGQQLMCYLHTEALTATLIRLDKLIVKGKPQDKRPKCLQKGNVAVVNLQVSRKVCVEPKPASGPPTSLSRLVLRDKGVTVAAGLVISLL